MARIYRAKIWQVRLPTGWSAKGDPAQGLVFLFKRDGVGLLTVQTEEKHPSRVKPHIDKAHGRLPLESTTHKTATTFRQTWTLTCGGRRLHLRYTCAAKNAGVEEKEVEHIVRNIEKYEETE